MTETVLRLYDFLTAHRVWRALSALAVVAAMLALVSRLAYKEDIADFLPVDSEQQNALKVYRDMAGADRIIAIVQSRDSAAADPDRLVAAADRFVDAVQRADTAHVLGAITSQADMSAAAEVSAFVYENMPYFLTEADYERMDSALSSPGNVARQLRADRQMLMLPAGSMMAENIGRDPLNLFTPVVQQLGGAASELRYEIYDGHIFSPDMTRALVTMTSPYGASETEHNARLADMLRQCADKATAGAPGVEIHLTGGPVIAVGNARQIKADSLVSVAVAVTLILALLLASLRNVRNLLLIAVSIGWGWLFAMGALALVHESVSVIVVGISSVILGIAVNYPLHYIAHLGHTPDRRKALREIVAPLLVGNITTVGAFLALVPLRSAALRDLGLFSSFLLIGTIVFVLVFLPHMARVPAPGPSRQSPLDRLSSFSPESKPAFVWAVVAVTAVLGYFSMQTAFDPDMSHINYMTAGQKADMEYLQRAMTTGGSLRKVYAISSDSTADGALDKSLRLQRTVGQLRREGIVAAHSGCTRFLCSRAEQRRRIGLWNSFWQGRRDSVMAQLRRSAADEGFAVESFSDFARLLDTRFQPHGTEWFGMLSGSVFASCLHRDSVAGRYNVVDVLSVDSSAVDRVEARLAATECTAFDVAGMNSAVANRLSADFNYIGFACAFIVFFFLWLSMGSIELAMLSFVPMAVSWIWILGIMALCGMQFNIVNIILATFIFGQGDDYTIFMTEGASYEYAYRRRMLASYKHSIILSALIMFIGIGTLVVARHPALHSLAEVTIAGMFSVVLMAYVFPPLVFRWLVQSRGRYRTRPLSLGPALVAAWARVLGFCLCAAAFAAGSVTVAAAGGSPRRRAAFRRLVSRMCRLALRCIPTVEWRVERECTDAGMQGAIVVADVETPLDAVAVVALSDSVVTASCGAEKACWPLRKMMSWLGHIYLTGDTALDTAAVKAAADANLSVAVMVCRRDGNGGAVPPDFKDILAPCAAAGIGTVPVMVCGSRRAMPDDRLALYRSAVTVSVRRRVAPSDGMQDRLPGMFEQWRAEAESRMRTAESFRGLVIDRYRYKGTEIFSSVRRSLRRNECFAAQVEVAETSAVACFANTGYGEMPLMYALVHATQKVWVAEPDADRRALLRYCAEGIAPNLTVCESLAQIETT